MKSVIKDYQAAMHGMQAGVRMLSGLPDEKECDPVHLRVGVNSALSDMAALAQLLIKKGIITEEEYMASILEYAQREHAAYEKRCSDKMGVKITLR